MKIGNIFLHELKDKYKTPLYIYDENKILENIKAFKNNFKHNEINTKIIYASKAFLTKYMVKLIKKEGLYLDCVSSGELYTAIKGGFDPANIFLHGNNKTVEELKEALNYKVGTIILDNLYEAKLLLSIKDKSYIPNIMLRVNLSFEVNTHSYIKTSYPDSKFGVGINDETINMIKTLLNDKTINFIGLHSHVGSQILEEKYFINHAREMMSLYKYLKEDNDINFSSLNIGGGFGIKYLNNDKELNKGILVNNIIKEIDLLNKKYNLNVNDLMIEPGRSIVGDAGYTLYTINQIKKTKNVNYLFVDGSMNDNLRTALYQAKYDALILGKENLDHNILYKVAGKACESGDIIIDEIKLPLAKEDDLLLVKSTGAYHYSMANNYNRLLIPAVVFINNDNIIEVVRRQTLEDLIKYDI